MQGNWHAVRWSMSLWLPRCSWLFCLGIFHMHLRAELLPPAVLNKSGYSMSRCAVPSVLSAQSPAYHSLPRVNKPLENAWILQEAMQDQSSSKVMGWDCGAVRPAYLPYQTQLGHVGFKCAPVKAGTLVMQVESACVGMVTSFCRARSQRSPRITLGAGCALPVPCLCPALALAEPTGRPTVLGRGRRGASASRDGARAGIWAVSPVAPLTLTGLSWLPAASLQLPAPRPLTGTASPAQAGSREERGELLRGPAPSGPWSTPA